MALGQDQLYNLQGPVQNKNVDPLFQKQGKRFLLPSMVFFSTCCGIFYLLLNVGHVDICRLNADLCPCPGLCWGWRVSAVTAEGQGRGLTTCPGDIDSTAYEQGSQTPVYAPLSHQISLTKHRVKDKIIKNFIQQLQSIKLQDWGLLSECGALCTVQKPALPWVTRINETRAKSEAPGPPRVLTFCMTHKNSMWQP